MADLINREHAAQAIEAYLCSQCEHDTDLDPECIACPHLDGDEILKSVPTIEPEVRHGEWHESWYTDAVCASICTNCGKATTQARTKEDMTNVHYPLCPYCGADMREEGGERE